MMMMKGSQPRLPAPILLRVWLLMIYQEKDVSPRPRFVALCGSEDASPVSLNINDLTAARLAYFEDSDSWRPEQNTSDASITLRVLIV